MENEDKVLEKKEQDECALEEKSAERSTDACCCYVMDPCGCYVDPCFTPVSSCCC